MGYGEPDSSGHPNYQERANHLFLNAVRIAPSQYRTTYMAGWSPSPSGILVSYPAVAPVYWEPKLGQSAYYHSNDMAVNGCFQHPSCDGTDTFTRIGSYYSCSGTMGENIAAGYSDPLSTSNQWLCDATGTPSACAADGSSAAGHRTNMMSANYKAAGVGYAYSASSTYKYYWTQDFGGTVCAPVPTNPVYSGSHRVSGGSTKFIALYYTSAGTAPSSANVVIAGTSYALTLDIGTAGKATYAYSQTSGAACRSYYFTFGTTRYPDTGCLVTYGEGSCTTSFDATCGGTTSATVTSTTAAATATTKAATSTTKAATSTTKAATSTTTTTTTTGGGSTYYLYTSSLQNGWTTYANSGVTLTHTQTYNGQTGLKAVLPTTSNGNWFWFTHSPQVTNVWTSLQFYAAASASGSFQVYFNGYYVSAKTVTTAWQFYSISFASLGAPATLPQLIFQNTGSSTLTLYLYNVMFV